MTLLFWTAAGGSLYALFGGLGPEVSPESPGLIKKVCTFNFICYLKESVLSYKGSLLNILNA